MNHDDDALTRQPPTLKRSLGERLRARLGWPGTSGQLAFVAILLALQVVACLASFEFSPISNWPMYAYRGPDVRAADRMCAIVTTDTGVQVDVSHQFFAFCRTAKLNVQKGTATSAEVESAAGRFLTFLKSKESQALPGVRPTQLTLRRESWIYSFNQATFQRVPREESTYAFSQ